MGVLWQDARFAIRTLGRNLGFTIIAVLTLALGIGVNNALFSIVNAFVLRPISVPDPGQIVSMRGIDRQGDAHFAFSYSDYRDYQRATTTLSGIVATATAFVPIGFPPPGPIAADGDSLAPGYEYASGLLVSPNYFSLLGAHAELGHLPGADELGGDLSSDIVISDSFWHRRLQSESDIVGKAIRLNGQQFNVVGVTSSAFLGTQPKVPDFWAAPEAGVKLGTFPSTDWQSDRGVQAFLLTGRLKPNTTLSHTQAELTSIAASLPGYTPGDDQSVQRIELKSASVFIPLEGFALPALLALLTVGSLILLIACANLANLVLARAVGRQREVGIRLALGASRKRLIRQLLTESTILALLGGVVALFSIVWCLRILYPLILSYLPFPAYITETYYFDVHPDVRVFLFTLCLSVATGILFGLGPALQASRLDLNESIKCEGARLTTGISPSRLRESFVIVQVAASFILLSAAALMVRSLTQLGNIDTGIHTEGVYSVSLGYPDSARAAAEVTAKRHELADRLRHMPGVISVCEVMKQPRTPGFYTLPVSAATGSGAADGTPDSVIYNIVSAEYFHTMKLPIVRGRPFSVDEVETGVPVVVVSESTERRLWPGGNALGQHLTLGQNQEKEGGTKTAPRLKDAEVIGVARDANSSMLWVRDPTYLYIPANRSYNSDLYLLVRFDMGRNAEISNLLTRTSRDLDPSLRVVSRPLDESLAYQRMPFQAMAGFALTFGVLSLLLATVGLYGAIAFFMRQRTREIGIRLAVGASPSQVQRLLIGSGLRIVGIGLGIGLVAGLMLSRVLSHVLITINAYDPLAFGGVIVILLGVGLIACYIPAHRVTRVVNLVSTLNPAGR